MYFQRANNVAPNFQPQRCFKIKADQRSIEKTLLLKRANPSSTGEIGGQKRGRRQLCGDVPRQRLPGPEREQRWRIGRVAAKVLDSRTSMTFGGKARTEALEHCVIIFGVHRVCYQLVILLFQEN